MPAGTVMDVTPPLAFSCDVNKVHFELQRVQSWLFDAPRLRAMGRREHLAGRGDSDRAAATGPAGRPLEASTPCRASFRLPKPGRSGRPDRRSGMPGRPPLPTRRQASCPATADISKRILPTGLPRLSRRLPHCFGAACQGSGSGFRSTVRPSPCKRRPYRRTFRSFALARGPVTGSLRKSSSWGPIPLTCPRKWRPGIGASLRAKQGQASDLASLLTVQTALERTQRPDTFEALADGGYMAVVHADGNGIGTLAKQANGEAGRAAFFHRNRVLLRRGLGQSDRRPSVVSGATAQTNVRMASCRSPNCNC